MFTGCLGIERSKTDSVWSTFRQREHKRIPFGALFLRLAIFGFRLEHFFSDWSFSDSVWSTFSQREHFRNPFSTNDVVLIGKGGALALFIQFPERQEAVEEIIGGAIDKKPDELCEIFIHA